MFLADPSVSKKFGKPSKHHHIKSELSERPPVIGKESGFFEKHDHQVVPMRMTSRDQEQPSSIPPSTAATTFKPQPLPKPIFHLGKDPAGITKHEDFKESDNAMSVAGGVPQSHSESGSIRSTKDSPPSVVGSSRGFEPEGSVDMSPTYSESVSITPPHFRWAKGINQLLDDHDGVSLFLVYLESQKLDHLLEFYHACKGFKQEVQKNAKEPDPEKKSQLKAGEWRLISAVNKKFINSSSKNASYRIDLIDEETRQSIKRKIAAAKTANKDAGKSFTTENLDVNIFDSAQQAVLDHLANKCYPNFLKSEIYIEHVKNYDVNNPVSVSGNVHSSSSSVIVHEKENRTDDSGISGMHEDAKVSTGSESVILGSATVASSLPTVDEDRELKILSDSNSSVRSKPLPSSFVVKKKSFETHPAGVDITSKSYAYHAVDANNSAYNPVSRQDSEIQSQSSGAVGGGDTTDDNQSSFTDGAPERPHRSQAHGGHGRRVSKWERRREQKMERKKIEESSSKNKDFSAHNIPRPWTNQGGVVGPQNPQAPQKPAEFAKLLTMKLQAVIAERNNAQLDKEEHKRLADKLSKIDTVSGAGDSSVASFPAMTSQNPFINRSSVQNVLDAESDQSILDDHVNRVFMDTPPTTRSPPPKGSKAMSQSFHGTVSSGHRTLPGRSSLHTRHHYGHGSGSGYSRTGYTSNAAGDLAYIPNQRAPGHRMVGGSGGRSYSDVDYNVHHNPQFQASRQPMVYNSQTKERVSDWVQKVKPFTFEDSGTQGRRAKSQDRSGQAKYSLPGSSQYQYNQMQPQPSGQFYGGPVQPGVLQQRLLETQQSRHNVSLMSGVNQSMKSMNVSLPTSEITEFTMAVYKYPQEKEDVPYRVRIPGKAVTLRQVKDQEPKKGSFRYYFKTEVDSEVCFEEETDERAKVPMWEGKIIVQCRND